MIKRKCRVPALVAMAIVTVVLAAAGPARADDATEARFHFQRGVELFQDGKLQSSLEQFLLSNRLVKNAKAVFNAAKCFELLNKFNEAYALYSEYLTFDLDDKERKEGEGKLKSVEAKVATIVVKSSPEGAEIFLDRKDLGSWGTTPRVIAVPPGSHEVLLEMKSYHPGSVPVTAIIGEQRSVELTLSARTGKVELKGPYPSATIALKSGEERTVTLPAVEEIPIGEQTIKIGVEGYIPAEKTVSVKEGETVEIDFVLAQIPPPTGSLNIVSTPTSALVKIDGEEFGFTPIIKPAAVGSHKVSLELKGRQSWKGKFNLEKDDSLFLTVDMVPESIPKKHKQGQIALWALGGAFAIGAVLTGAMALSTKEKFKEDQSASLRNRGVALNVMTDGLGGLALVCVLSGTIWYLVTRRATKMKSKGEFSHKQSAVDSNLDFTTKEKWAVSDDGQGQP